MLARTYSFGLNGLEAYPVTVEADVTQGLPAMTIVGLPDNAIKESKDRVRSAIRNAGFVFPCARITINLAPADTKKAGPSFDLAIAFGILAAAEIIPPENLQRFVLLGELSLGGEIKPVSGTLSVALATLQDKFDGIIVPRANANEAALAEKIPVYPFQTLQEAAAFLQAPGDHAAFQRNRVQNPLSAPSTDIDFQDVKGQSHAKRGLEIAAAGGHNALMRWTQYNGIRRGIRRGRPGLYL